MDSVIPKNDQVKILNFLITHNGHNQLVLNLAQALYNERIQEAMRIFQQMIAAN